MRAGSAAADAGTRDHAIAQSVRALADRLFSRAAGAPLVGGNAVRLLKDAGENYPAWLDAIASARRHIHFESYIVHEDEAGTAFADALIAAARRGVAVRLVYDWLGGLGRTSRRFWNRLRQGGVEVRCFNPPRFDAPFGWVTRDHRKVLTADGEVAFVSGLCVGRMWAGDPAKGIEPWRDTGVEIRGPAVADVERAFAQVWLTTGEPVPDAGTAPAPDDRGAVSLRIVAAEPGTAGLFRLDQMIAAMARERIWLTDAYYAGTSPYVQALREAARSGVDVRLLLPDSTDVPLISPLSRSGYRTLLEAGVRVFEWNGPMLHAKTAVVDGRWARVGSSNLNIASWLGNCEMDVVIEDEGFAADMERMYLDDLGRATEVVLERMRARRQPRLPGADAGVPSVASGSAGPAAAGAVRLGHAIGAAFTDHRPLGPIEVRVTAVAGSVLLAAAVLFSIFPKALAYPAAALCAWVAASLLYKGYTLVRRRRRD